MRPDQICSLRFCDQPLDFRDRSESRLLRVFGILMRQTPGYQIDIRACLADTDAGLQPRDDAQNVVTATGHHV